MRTSESICSLAHRSPGSEGGGGKGWGGGWPIYLQPLLPPLPMFASPLLSHFLFCLWQKEAERQTVVKRMRLRLSACSFCSLIGSSKAAACQAQPRRCDPVWIFFFFFFLPSLSNFVLNFKHWPVLAYFSIWEQFSFRKNCFEKKTKKRKKMYCCILSAKNNTAV